MIGEKLSFTVYPSLHVFSIVQLYLAMNQGIFKLKVFPSIPSQFTNVDKMLETLECELLKIVEKWRKLGMETSPSL
jgi:hypothetical protein